MKKVWSLDVQLLVRAYPQMIGLARYTRMLEKGLAAIGVPVRAIEPSYPAPIRAAHAALHPLGYDLKTFFTTFPVAAPLQRDTITHLTTQQMASLFSVRPGLRPAIVTVHDLVPYLMRDHPEQRTYGQFADRWFDGLAMRNLRRADRLIAVSSSTAQTLVDRLQCTPERIRVVPNGCDHIAFRPTPVPDAFRERHGLPATGRYILYVGSENPRKNLPRLLQAFAIVHARLPDTRLIKAGNTESPAREARLHALVRELGLAGCVIFPGSISQDELALFYNAADVFAFPSLYEGFGLPAVEAMACGTPVVCSNTTSLPEVVGDAAIAVDPCDIEALAEALLKTLQDTGLRQEMAARGLARAGQFTWERTARETAAVYQELGAVG